MYILKRKFFIFLKYTGRTDMESTRTIRCSWSSKCIRFRRFGIFPSHIHWSRSSRWNQWNIW